MRLTYSGVLPSILLLIELPVPVRAQDAQPHPATAVVYTAATVTRNVRPDLALLTIQFTAEGANPQLAERALAARADSLRIALMGAGIPHDSLVTARRWYWWGGRFDVEVKTRYIARQVPARDGSMQEAVIDTVYRGHDAIEVRIRELSKVGTVIDSVVAHHITDISGPQFTTTDISAVQDDALHEATVRARHEAESIAVAGGAQLGRVISLSTQAEPFPRAYDWSEIYVSPAGGVSGGEGERVRTRTEVVEPTVPISVTVYGRWELVPTKP